MDIELAVDALELAPHIDQMVLFSGDSDFRALVEAMQRRGVRVSVVSTVATQPVMIADELRRQADEFLDLVHLIPKVGREASDRPERSPRGPGDYVERPERGARGLGDHGDRPERSERPRVPGTGLERRYGIRQAPPPDEDAAEG
jgi:hypothetical protein